MSNQVLTWAELQSALGSRRAAERAIANGDWHRVLRGAYSTSPALDLASRCRAVQRLLSHGAYVADRCLLWLHGIDVLPPGPPLLEVVVARGAVVPRRTGVLAREAALPARDRVVVRGVRCLRLERATADLLRRLPLAEAVVVCDAVQHAGRLTAEGLGAELTSHARLRGVRQATRALELSSPLAESPPESRLRVLLVLAGLVPVPQFDVHGAEGRWLARVDLAFPEARLAIEYDGREVHERPDVFVRDRRRQNDLVAAGWTVLRYTAEDLRLRPYAVAAEVHAFLRRAAA